MCGVRKKYEFFLSFIFIQGLYKSSDLSSPVTYSGSKPPYEYNPNLSKNPQVPSVVKNPNQDQEPEPDRTDPNYTMILIVAPVCAGVALLIVGCIVIVYLRYNNLSLLLFLLNSHCCLTFDLIISHFSFIDVVFHFYLHI